MKKNFTLHLDGYQLQGSLEFEDGELKNMTTTEKESYMYDEIVSYCTENIEIELGEEEEEE